MVDWKDPLQILRASDAFQKIIFAFFGLYVWELFVTSDFEWSLLTRRRAFHWPLVFFFLCRYCMFFAFIGLIISLNVTTLINCQALFTFNSWTGNMAILCASTCLMLRTIALWDRKKYIVGILGMLCLAHWALLYRTMFVVVAEWDPTHGVCVVVQTNSILLNVTFFFTMGFDLVILLFTAVALLGRPTAKTGLWRMLFQDGLVYFLISFSMNCVPAVLSILNLNPSMNVIATIPAATITSIAACRAVMRLLTFKGNDLYIHSAVASTPRRIDPNPPKFKPQKLPLTRPEVHVTTEHITMAEFPTSGTSSPYHGTENSHRNSYTRSLKESEKGSSFEFGSPISPGPNAV
ncbi:hypothetical protein DFP72DRAFT_876875 [Ephemerocybe angulata]|uniref:Uncharacterized protein n=1 Tax=Ephemerocybe angulata TaxID=980116 RepID=A0A8H6IC23_9AGAR|nr:hypothetical protein DFP72DRAFT_876875 [Tulosesus angulatus]